MRLLSFSIDEIVSNTNFSAFYCILSCGNHHPCISHSQNLFWPYELNSDLLLLISDILHCRNKTNKNPSDSSKLAVSVWSFWPAQRALLRLHLVTVLKAVSLGGDTLTLGCTGRTLSPLLPLGSQDFLLQPSFWNLGNSSFLWKGEVPGLSGFLFWRPFSGSPSPISCPQQALFTL